MRSGASGLSVRPLGAAEQHNQCSLVAQRGFKNSVLQHEFVTHTRASRQWRVGCQDDDEAVPGGGRFRAVLMDFGSAAPARVDVRSRAEALAVQEEAEAHCRRACGYPTLPYPHPAYELAACLLLHAPSRLHVHLLLPNVGLC